MALLPRGGKIPFQGDASGLRRIPELIHTKETLRELLSVSRFIYPGSKRDGDGESREALAPGVIGFDGAFSLDAGGRAGAFLLYARRAVPATEADVRELWEFGMDDEKVPKTPNPLNKRTFLKRKQHTFGGVYKFAGQATGTEGDRDELAWPALVRAVLEDARARSSVPETLRAAHVNWYEDGCVGLAPHNDKEGIFVPGAPIYSYTFLLGGHAAHPRGFQIYATKPTTSQQARTTFEFNLALGHADLLVMCGDMQQRYYHGVLPMPNKFKCAPRINITVRSVEERTKRLAT